MLIRFCAWCNQPLTWLDRVAFRLGLYRGISHGVCTACKAVELKKLEEVKQTKEKLPA